MHHSWPSGSRWPPLPAPHHSPLRRLLCPSRSQGGGKRDMRVWSTHAWRECAVGSQKEGGKAVSMVTLNLNKTSHTDRWSLERHRSVLPAEPETADCQPLQPASAQRAFLFPGSPHCVCRFRTTTCFLLISRPPFEHGTKGPVAHFGDILKSRVEIPSLSRWSSQRRLCQTRRKQQDRSARQAGMLRRDG